MQVVVLDAPIIIMWKFKITLRWIYVGTCFLFAKIIQNGDHPAAALPVTVIAVEFNPHFLRILINNLDAGLHAAEINAKSDQFIRALCLIYSAIDFIVCYWLPVCCM